MTKKTITAKDLRNSLREVIIDINQNQAEYILEYVKGMKVKISGIVEENQQSRFGNYLKSRKFKPAKQGKNYTNQELRKMAYDS